MPRHNNQLAHNIPQLQNLIKRDPDSYKDEFNQQYLHYKAMVEIFRLHPEDFNKGFHEIVMLMAQVAHCYPNELSNYPQEIVDLLRTNITRMDNDMRMTFCKALILLRNKNLLAPTDLLSLFFQLLACDDKNLRSFLQTHIVSDIKNLNAKSKNTKLNKTLQNFMYSMLKGGNAKAAKMSVDIMIELYQKNVWNDAKTVNVIVTACFSKFTKVMVAAFKFFLGSDKENDEEENSDSDPEIDPKSVMMANRVNKKTRKRQRQLKKVKHLIKKQQSTKSKAPVYNFSGLHLINDPQGMAEKLFAKLERSNERFEVKLMILDVVSRLIGVHNLILFNYYPYIQRFMQPHQREVTRIMQFAAQSAHELVPPEVIEPVVRTLVDNFVTERNSSDAMAMGLNAIREVCARCPLAMSKDLLEDLAQYKRYKERSVMMAARSLIFVYRRSYPSLLRKKDRGRPTEAMTDLKQPEFGELNAPTYVAGAEVILEEETKDGETDDTGSDSDSDSWIDMPSDEEKEDNASKLKNKRKIEMRKKKLQRRKKSDKQKSGADSREQENVESAEPEVCKEELAAAVSISRLLTDDDFKKIDSALIRKQITVPKKGVKRAAESDPDVERGELVKLADIENIYKKRRNDKAARLESVQKGREGREKRGFHDRRQNPFCSKSNSEKRKTKSYMMIKHKVQRKVKRSFKEKQIALRNHLLSLKKFQ